MSPATAPLWRERQSPSSSSPPSSSQPPPPSQPPRSQSSPSQPSPEGRDEDNPFAPPPQDRPDQPWQPRHQPGAGSGGQGDDAQGEGDRPDDDQPQQPPVWGSQWSSRQPSRGNGGFGTTPGANRPPGQGGQNGAPSGPRWDPSDPAQRRARYALLSGMWGFFFALFSLPQVALLLGALALYWGISALRAKPRQAKPDAPAAPALDAPPPAPDATRAQLPPPVPGGSKPQATAAISGVVTGGIAVAIVAATFTFQLVYSDYYTCVDDALTHTSRQSCEDHLPKQLRPILTSQN